MEKISNFGRSMLEMLGVLAIVERSGIGGVYLCHEQTQSQ